MRVVEDTREGIENGRSRVKSTRKGIHQWRKAREEKTWLDRKECIGPRNCSVELRLSTFGGATGI